MLRDTRVTPAQAAEPSGAKLEDLDRQAPLLELLNRVAPAPIARSKAAAIVPL